jgi:hypothetical protein
MTDLEKRALKIFDAIFSDRPEVDLEEGTYRIGKTRGGLRSVTIEGIFYIEQNPQKKSRWAKEVQAGHQIMWGIKNRVYVLHVVDGVFKQLKDI